MVYLLPVAALVLGLMGGFLYSCDLGRRPVMFGQAKVVALDEGRAAFRLFDGQVIELALGRKAVLRVGDHGRLTYRAGRFLGLEA